MSWKHFSDRLESSKTVRIGRGAGLETRSPFIFDHFAYGAGAFNSHVPQNWVTTETGTGTPFAPGATGVSVAIGASGAVTDNGEEIAGKLVGWNPSTMGGLTLEVRAKFVGTTTALDGDFGIGFGDAVTYTNSLPYVFSAASAFTTSVPTEFAGFWYSSIPTSGTLYAASGNYVGLVSTIANVNTVASSAIVKDSSYHIYRVEMDSSANTQFYIDDVLVGSAAAAITANTAMTPYIVAIAKNSHAHTATVDWVYVRGNYV